MTPLSFLKDHGGRWFKDLRQTALRVFNCPSTASGCERNWSTMGFYHSQSRNKLGPNKLMKLTYVKTNDKYVQARENEYFESKLKSNSGERLMEQQISQMEDEEVINFDNEDDNNDYDYYDD
jgi:hypothetical protein